MKAALFLAAASAALINAAATPVEKRASVPTVTVQGNAFYAGGQRFFIRGIDYQPGGASDAKDPIADSAGCQRDIEYFKKLGINTVRVYTVDNTANHDTCMNALADAGIYLALDVNTPLYSLRRDKPGQSYNPTYLQNVFATIDVFSKYDNTLLFFSGNEVINDDTTTTCAPYVKAVTRDMRQYIKTRGYRSIPVGYSAADVESNRFEMAQYMNCGTDDQRSDFYAFNDYSWCDPSSFQVSGWDKKVQQYSNYSLPIFLSEWGCNKNKRTFGAAKSLYSSDMSAVYSGGLVYEYSEEANEYGLVSLSGSTVTPNDDFTALQSAYAANPAPSGSAGARTGGGASTCPDASSTWNISPWTGQYLPAMPSGAATYMQNGAGKGPGLVGKGSQEAPGGSTASAVPGSASVTAGSSGAATTSKGAAIALAAGDLGMGPFVCMAVVLLSTLFGATLI
ncbi:hypothetical protein AMS68_001638 [Peltaster fructicola]|uniref:1,3-beta-glucanosyltransferase n=1 Tax=Peltaster fructicola TaxID=286661 RepID=A0A6H0XN92_9PEZI|nr:hypothetical protein AMS68_001638 [Peltaster fructicola]